MTDKRSEVAAALHKWAKTEMNFVPQGRHVNAPMPTPQELRGICRGSLLDVWEFVTARVYSAQTARKIKGNLALFLKSAHCTVARKREETHEELETARDTRESLNALGSLNHARHGSGVSYKVKYKGDTKFSQERAELMQKQQVLKAQLDGVKSDVRRLDQDLKRLQKDIISAENEYQNSCSAMSDLQHKQTLTAAYSAECKANTARYEEYIKLIVEKLSHYEALKRAPDQSLVFSKPGSSNMDSGVGSPGLESACTKRVRESCCEIASFHQKKAKGDFGSDTKAKSDKEKQLWAEVKEVLADNPADQIVRSLADISEESARKLRQITNNIDLKKDAKKLSFEFKHSSSGVLKDISKTPDIMLTVQQLFEKKQLAHMQTFMEAERSKNNAWRLDKRLAQLVAQIHQKLASSFADQPGVLEMAKTLFATELELASDKGAFEKLKDCCKELEVTAASATTEEAELVENYHQIQVFKKQNEEKQKSIRNLIGQNSEAKKQHETPKRENLKYMQSTLCTHEAGTISTATQMRDGVTNEIERFAQLPLQILRLTSLDDGRRVPVIQLSINRFSDQSGASGGRVITEVLQLLKFPLYKAPETLLQHAVKLKCEISVIQTLLDSQDLLHNYMSVDHTGDFTALQRITDLTKEVTTHDENLLKQILPVLQSRLSESTDSLGSCIDVKDALTAWWEQPVQHLIPWVKLDDLTLQQWMDKWTVAVTRLRQLGV